MPLQKLGLLPDPPKVNVRKIYALYYSPSQIEAYREQIWLGRLRRKVVLVDYEIPSKFTWEQKMAPIRDQGNFGSCAAMSTTAVNEFHHQTTDLSEAWLYEISNNICYCSTCDMYYDQEEYHNKKCSEITCPKCGKQLERICDVGRYLYMVVRQLLDFGQPLESCWPYSRICTGQPPRIYGEANPEWCELWEADAATRKIDSIDTPEITVENLKHAIYQAPISIGMKVYDNFGTYRDGVYDTETGSYRGGHAIVFVGWDDTERYFLLRNSWGSGWGIDGYCKYSYDLIGSLFDAYLLKKKAPIFKCDVLKVKEGG